MVWLHFVVLEHDACLYRIIKITGLVESVGLHEDRGLGGSSPQIPCPLGLMLVDVSCQFTDDP